jgi:hypothetical protein
MKIPPQHEAAAAALAPLLHGLTGKLVAIDGHPGVGKTTLGRFLAWRFNVALIETDWFLIERQGRLVYRNDEIARIITKRIDGWNPKPVIVDGASVLRLLTATGRSPDFVIYVTNKNAPESYGDLAADLAAYDAEFAPRERADLTLAIDNPG